MPLNVVKPGSQMYEFIELTWNPIRGECEHNCKYCYLKRFPVGDLRLDEKALQDNLGSQNRIFVGSSTDMFAENVPTEWIMKVLDRCMRSNNRYLFQTKNPHRFLDFMFPEKTTLGITLESNRHYPGISNAPPPVDRTLAFGYCSLPKMVSIEPVMDFDLGLMLSWIRTLSPNFVSIGADSRFSKLPEPSKEKLLELIAELNEVTVVRLKKNLDRIIQR